MNAIKYQELVEKEFVSLTQHGDGEFPERMKRTYAGTNVVVEHISDDRYEIHAVSNYRNEWYHVDDIPKKFGHLNTLDELLDDISLPMKLGDVVSS
ncbi:hypothetical protein KW805_01460 [Candidatus Pacearchaeota archaeon]|nr:hypothetical protein [Candidatus Pacearchaeota archaeon]